MAEDSDELGRYTDAKEKLDTALTARHNLATELAVLANKIATGPDLDESNSDEAVVTSFDAKRALDIVGQMIEAEAEIDSAVEVINRHAAQVGMPFMRMSDL